MRQENSQMVTSSMSNQNQTAPSDPDLIRGHTQGSQGLNFVDLFWFHFTPPPRLQYSPPTGPSTARGFCVKFNITVVSLIQIAICTTDCTYYVYIVPLMYVHELRHNYCYPSTRNPRPLEADRQIPTRTSQHNRDRVQIFSIAVGNSSCIHTCD